MQKVLGYPVLAVGLIMGLQALIPTSPAPLVPAPVDKEIAFLPPREPAPAPRVQQAIVAPRPVPAIAPRAKPVQAASNTGAASVTVAPWRTAVVTFQGTGDTQTAITSTTAASNADRYELARNIQRELKRVGCYYGEIDGSWGVGSKRALTAFMDRVNASLPISEPDYILLALIRSQPAAACSVPCPQGQSHASEGRCVPNAILAQAMRKNGGTDVRSGAPMPAAPDTHIAWTAEVRPTAGAAPNLPPPAPLIGRMSIGGPRPDAVSSTASPPGFRARTAELTGTATGELDGGGAYAPRVSTSVPQDGAEQNLPPLPDGANTSVDGAVPLPAAVAAPPRETRAPKPSRRYVSGSRSVQNLFTHPLGRM
jgi:hypothetical protein